MTAKLKAKPKAKKASKKADQSKRFKKAARDLADAGELNLTDAGGKFEGVIKKLVRQKSS